MVILCINSEPLQTKNKNHYKLAYPKTHVKIDVIIQIIGQIIVFLIDFTHPAPVQKLGRRTSKTKELKQGGEKHPPRAGSRKFFFLKKRNSPPPGHKNAKPRPLGRKIVLKPTPGRLFLKVQQKHKTEVMKNSTEMLICLEIFK